MVHIQKKPFSVKRRANMIIKSGKRDSNSRPQPWQGCALPTELFPHFSFYDFSEEEETYLQKYGKSVKKCLASQSERCQSDKNDIANSQKPVVFRIFCRFFRYCLFVCPLACQLAAAASLSYGRGIICRRRSDNLLEIAMKNGCKGVRNCT